MGGFNASDDSLYLDSGRGYNIDNQVKPDFLAPAVEVFGPDLWEFYKAYRYECGSRRYGQGQRHSCLEWGVVRGNSSDMNNALIKNYLFWSERKNAGKGLSEPGRRLRTAECIQGIYKYEENDMNYLLGSTAAFLCDYAAKEKVEKPMMKRNKKNFFMERYRLKIS